MQMLRRLVKPLREQRDQVLPMLAVADSDAHRNQCTEQHAEIPPVYCHAFGFIVSKQLIHAKIFQERLEIALRSDDLVCNRLDKSYHVKSVRWVMSIADAGILRLQIEKFQHAFELHWIQIRRPQIFDVTKAALSGGAIRSIHDTGAPEQGLSHIRRRIAGYWIHSVKGKRDWVAQIETIRGITS